jgi:hypothetical protein
LVVGGAVEGAVMLGRSGIGSSEKSDDVPLEGHAIAKEVSVYLHPETTRIREAERKVPRRTSSPSHRVHKQPGTPDLA